MMNGGNNYIKFEVLGEEFTVKSDVSREYFLTIVEYLNKKISEMKEKLPHQTNVRVLVFSALDIIDELLQVKKEMLNKNSLDRLTRLGELLASVIENPEA